MDGATDPRRHVLSWSCLLAAIVFAGAVTVLAVGQVSDERKFPFFTGDVEMAGPPSPSGVLRDGVEVFWTRDVLEDDVLAVADAHPVTTSVMSSATLDLTRAVAADGTIVTALDGGRLIPLDAVGVDPERHARFATGNTARAFAELDGVEAILGETSALLRQVGVGATLTVNGVTVEVVEVLPDDDVGGAEIVLARSTLEQIRGGPRGLLTTDAMVADLIEATLGETPHRRQRAEDLAWVRNGNLSVPQAHLKVEYGEFWLIPRPDGSFTPDPAWKDENIVLTILPIVGETRCHKLFIPKAVAALEEIQRQGVSVFVKPEQFAGCWSPRRVRGSGNVSRHAWGAAIDINSADNPLGVPPRQDVRVVDAFVRQGLEWGGLFLRPDGMHFEEQTSVLR